MCLVVEYNFILMYSTWELFIDSRGKKATELTMVRVYEIELECDALFVWG